MANSEDLINFDVIEDQKENIQSLPSGRSAKALASIYSPISLGRTPTPSHTQNLNDAIRQEYEKELLTVDESDDPLDIYDRYVRWTLDAYPSPQAKESQLLPLLERATKAFLSSCHYKNDPRYLKLWLQYIRLFSDSPRETFAFLARHNVGDGLALFYEEFAAWLESAGRWTQAEEVYGMGIEREARPVERLIRKYGEFQHRSESRPHDEDEPRSPALPTVRLALAAKVDPFAGAAAETADPQARDRAAAARPVKTGKQKLSVFSDETAPPKPGSGSSGKGWESIGSVTERRKENTMEAKPWAGQTLKGGKKNTGVPKMAIFRDESVPDQAITPNTWCEEQQTVNPRTGRTECVFVNLEAVYPNPDDPYAEEYSFEELRARHRGWLDYDWAAIRREEEETARRREQAVLRIHKDEESSADSSRSQQAAASLAKGLQVALPLNDTQDENDENAVPSQEEIEKARLAKKLRREERANRTRKIKVMEVRAETQTIQTNLASPTGPKIRRKKSSAEPTMTLHTREAVDEIYDLFNHTLKLSGNQTDEAESGDDSGDDDDDDDYTSAGESTGTGRISGATSEYGDETGADLTEVKSTAGEEEDEDDATNASRWTEFSAAKDVADEDRTETDGETAQTGASSWEVLMDDREVPSDHHHHHHQEDLITPTSPEVQEAPLPTRYVPLPPDDYRAPTRPYRDQTQMAQNRLPFMTPIVEKTESSIGASTAIAEKDYFNSKTPCRRADAKTPAIPQLADGEPWSSPFQDLLNNEDSGVPGKVSQPALPKPNKARVPLGESKAHPSGHVRYTSKEAVSKGPIIKDAQCNPIDEQIRRTILDQIQPPLSSYQGYHEHPNTTCNKRPEIHRFAKAAAKTRKSCSDKAAANLASPPTLRFDGAARDYTIKRELGRGAFAPVYLVSSTSPSTSSPCSPSPSEEDSDAAKPASRPGQAGAPGAARRNRLEAIKAEEPPTPWEFYMLRQAKRRLGASRAADSVVHAYEMHLFRDEGYLVEEYRGQGTLLDLVNLARADQLGGGGGGGGGGAGGGGGIAGGGAAAVMDEATAMFFAVELLRTVEALHAKGVVHGDLKADNVLVRLEGAAAGGEWSGRYRRDGGTGWTAREITLIDFGRGIDMRAFRPDVQFVADWRTGEGDCAEMREMRPWTFQVDYHGLAGVVHAMLFGRHLDTVAERGGGLGAAGGGPRYRAREALKRYWQVQIWEELFALLLNPLAGVEREEGARLPALRGMRACRERMEEWLEENCERGVGLKGLLRRIEGALGDRRR